MGDREYCLNCRPQLHSHGRECFHNSEDGGGLACPKPERSVIHCPRHSEAHVAELERQLREATLRDIAHDLTQPPAGVYVPSIMTDNTATPQPADIIDRLLAFSATLANEEEDLVNEAAKELHKLQERNRGLEEQVANVLQCLDDQEKAANTHAEELHGIAADLEKQLAQLRADLQAREREVGLLKARPVEKAYDMISQLICKWAHAGSVDWAELQSAHEAMHPVKAELKEKAGDWTRLPGA